MTEKDDFWIGFKALGEAMAEREKELDEMVERCDYDMKLAITRWVMKHIVEQAEEGGSYRYLIYDRLGFGPDAYAPLCSSGLTISNEFDLSFKEEITKALVAEDYKQIKSIVGLCDVDGCYGYASCGWPSADGYRHTCGVHMKELDNGQT
jgi:hypothetical protein